MDERYVRERLRDLFKRHGFRVDTQTDAVICHRCHAKILPPRGKPDMTILHPVLGVGFYVEVKVARRDDTSFPFARIEPHQRRILTAAGNVAYLGLGEIVRVATRDRLENLWLIPWRRWRALEEMYLMFHHRKSIPRSELRILAAEFSAADVVSGWCDGR